MDFHPVSNIFPLIEGRDFESLKEDIRQNGLLEPIWLHPDGSILDGRNRYLACEAIGINPSFRSYNSDLSTTALINFVISMNEKRRHLTSSQRATVALSALPMLEAEARERQRGAGQEYGRGQNSSVKELTELSEPQRATQAAADLFSTNRQYVSDAKRIRDESPETFEQVKSGELSIPKAKEAIQQPKPTNGMKPKQNYRGDTDTSGPMDRCQTPAYAFAPLAEYIPSWMTRIWEPAKGEGYLAEAISSYGFEVITSDILTGQNFFEYEPDNEWDCLITNPPYSVKYDWLERCYELKKSFALLLPVETLGAQTAQKFFRDYGIQVIFLDKRINFKMPNKGWDGSAAQFPTAWFCWGWELPMGMVFAEIDRNGI